VSRLALRPITRMTGSSSAVRAGAGGRSWAIVRSEVGGDCGGSSQLAPASGRLCHVIQPGEHCLDARERLYERWSCVICESFSFYIRTVSAWSGSNSVAISTGFSVPGTDFRRAQSGVS